MFTGLNRDGRNVYINIDNIAWLEWDDHHNGDKHHVTVHFSGGTTAGIYLDSEELNHFKEILRNHRHHLERSISDGIRSAQVVA